MYIGSIVLAGGRSRRMGQPKESMPFLGTTLLGRTVDTLLLHTYPVVVVARTAEQELPPLPLEAELAFDDRPAEGPLVAIASGLRSLRGRSDAAFVCACDLPFLDGSVIGWMADLLGDRDLLLPRVDGVLQPLAALYRVGVLPAVERAIEEGIRSPRSLADRVPTRVLEEAEIDAFDPRRRFLRNINGPEDYQEALREAGEPR